MLDHLNEHCTGRELHRSLRPNRTCGCGGSSPGGPEGIGEDALAAAAGCGVALSLLNRFWSRSVLSRLVGKCKWLRKPGKSMQKPLKKSSWKSIARSLFGHLIDNAPITSGLGNAKCTDQHENCPTRPGSKLHLLKLESKVPADHSTVAGPGVVVGACLGVMKPSCKLLGSSIVSLCHEATVITIILMSIVHCKLDSAALGLRLSRALVAFVGRGSRPLTLARAFGTTWITTAMANLMTPSASGAAFQQLKPLLPFDQRQLSIKMLRALALVLATFEALDVLVDRSVSMSA